jgi:hypothetical protein
MPSDVVEVMGYPPAIVPIASIFCERRSILEAGILFLHLLRSVISKPSA